jgi:hypothetical protein
MERPRRISGGSVDRPVVSPGTIGASLLAQ